jgi:hypothetical protein
LCFSYMLQAADLKAIIDWLCRESESSKLIS